MMREIQEVLHTGLEEQRLRSPRFASQQRDQWKEAR